MYQTIIPAGRAKEDLVLALVAGIQELTGAKVEMEYMLLLSTDDVEVSAILFALKEKLLGKNGRNGAKAVKTSKASKAKKVQTEMGRASRRIVDTGEILSLVELKKMMSDGQVMDGVVVENNRGERFVVMSGELIKEPQS